MAHFSICFYPVAAPSMAEASRCCVILLQFLLGDLEETFKEEKFFRCF